MLTFEWNFLGLSNETKPKDNEKVIDGTTFYECDTGNFFVYYDGTWYQQTFVTDEGINVYVYKLLMHKMFKKMFDTNLSKTHIITPDIGSEIEFTTVFPADITDFISYGNTTQQTYSGKNLFNKDNYSYLDGYFENKGTIVTTTAGRNIVVYLPCQASTTYAFSSQEGLGLNTRAISTTSELPASGVQTNLEGAVTGVDEKTYTTPADATYIVIRFQSALGSTMADIADAVFANFQIEEGSTSTSYEQYVGGVPSPNPLYPQTVQIATGLQTITMTYGEISQNFTIDLDSLELCKIGNTIDYIYKNGDDWYIHKSIDKVLGSTADWANNGTNVNFTQGRLKNVDVAPNLSLSQFADMYYANIFPNGDMAKNQIVSPSTIYRCNSTNSSSEIIVNIGVTYAPDWAAFKSIVQDLVLYYILATPTEAKITNTTVISQLNALLDYTFPVGENSVSVTSSNLPVLLKLTITERE